MNELLPRATPAMVGASAVAVARFTAALDESGGIHTMTVVRRGHVIAECAWAPYRRDLPHALYSVSKSVTSLAVGLAIAEGRFALDSRVIDLLPRAAPEHPSQRLAAMTIEHLLTMSTGHEAEPGEWGREHDWAQTVLAADPPLEPGSRFVYNTPATYLLSEILQTATGLTLTDYLRPRLFAPLGFEDPWWLQSPTGVDAGGFGLMLRPEELAALGDLLLRRGRWAGEQLVPASWIEAATGRRIANGTGEDSDWTQGYGYQFWRCRHDAYRADGAFGQFVVVLPQHETAVAITGGMGDMQAPLDALWNELLPGLSVGASVPGSAAPTFPGTPPHAATRPRILAVPAAGGRRAGEDRVLSYDGPIRRLRIGRGVLGLDGAELRCEPDRWSEARLVVRGVEGLPVWFGDRVAVSGGYRGEEFRAEIRTLQDAPTFVLRIAPDGALTITRDVGFDGPDVWAGSPIDQAPDAAHQMVVSP